MCSPVFLLITFETNVFRLSLGASMTSINPAFLPVSEHAGSSHTRKRTIKNGGEFLVSLQVVESRKYHLCGFVLSPGVRQPAPNILGTRKFVPHAKFFHTQ